MDGPLSDEEALEYARRLEAIERQQREDDFIDVLSSKAGRRFLWRIIDDIAGAFGGSYTGEAMGTAFAEGRRSIGIAVMTEAQRLAPGAYVQMVQEQLESERRRAAERVQRGPNSPLQTKDTDE